MGSSAPARRTHRAIVHAFIWGTTSTTVRQRAVPAQFQGRVGSVYLTGVVGGIVVGSGLGGLVASAWGITAPFWFAFGGSALILVLTAAVTSTSGCGEIRRALGVNVVGAIDPAARAVVEAHQAW